MLPLAALLALPLHAAEQAPAPVITGASPWSLLLGLLFLLLLVVGGWWLTRRMAGLQPVSGRALRVVASAMVGPRERVVLLDVGGEQLLLGVAPGQVTLLKPLEQPLPIDGGGDDFAARLRQLLQPGAGR